MKVHVDTAANLLIVTSDAGSEELSLYSQRAFELLSDLWLKVGWNEKYPYAFSWMGRPIIQQPEDIVRYQEVVYRVQPDIIVETGVAHGGSLILSASLLKAMGRGRVIGVDIDIRPHNRRAIEAHELSPLITLIQGSSVDPAVVCKVKGNIGPHDRTLVILDSAHTKHHVLRELECYHDIVSLGSYIVATDGSMQALHDVPRGRPEWVWDNPSAAAVEFLKLHSEFAVEQPPWPFNESSLRRNITHWPGAWLKRVR